MVRFSLEVVIENRNGDEAVEPVGQVKVIERKRISCAQQVRLRHHLQVREKADGLQIAEPLPW